MASKTGMCGCVFIRQVCVRLNPLCSHSGQAAEDVHGGTQELSRLGPPASPGHPHRDFPMTSSPYPTTCPAHSWVSSIASAGGGTSELPLAFSFTHDQKGSTWVPPIMGDLSLKAKTLAVVNQLP